jgi:hypothetical protein
MGDQFNALELRKEFGILPSKRTFMAAMENHKLQKHHICKFKNEWGVFIANYSKVAGSVSLQKAADFAHTLNNG